MRQRGIVATAAAAVHRGRMRLPLGRQCCRARARRRHFFTRGDGDGDPEDDARQRTHTEAAVLFPYPPALVLHVVTDVANYREFVPWCVDSRVMQDAPAGADVPAPLRTDPGHAGHHHTEFFGELSVGFKLFAERYVSRVTVARDAGDDNAWPATVTAEALNTGLFQFLQNRWVLRPGPRGADVDCLLDFFVDFRFHSAVYSRASGVFFDEVVSNMNAAFLKRCGAVEGEWHAEQARRARVRLHAEAGRARRASAAAATTARVRRVPDTGDQQDAPSLRREESLLRGWPGGDGGVTPR